jgi:hypothetical protein
LFHSNDMPWRPPPRLRPSGKHLSTSRLSEIAVETCGVACLAAQKPDVGSGCLGVGFCIDPSALLVNEPEGVTAIKLAATKAIVAKSTMSTHLAAARSVANVPEVWAIRQR